MNKIAFTICSRSYIGMANILRDSFLENHADYDFKIILADTDEEQFSNCIYAETLLNKYLSSQKYEEMAFKYDVTEFCTSLKPFVIKYYLENEYDLVVYIDPDIRFYSRFKELDDLSKDIFITPHIISMREEYDGDEKEENFLKFGIYNCGFIGFRKSKISMSIINWWAAKLFDYSYADAEWGVYTDQKWIDFLPNYVPLSSLSIIHNYGCNVAPWNFYEREIFQQDSKYYVQERNGNSDKYELVFIHFSGYNYTKLENGIIQHSHRSLKNYPDIVPFFKMYGNELKNFKVSEGFLKTYKYNYFLNGDPVLKFHRRIYREFLQNNNNFDALFSTSGHFYKLLKKNGMIVYNVSDVKSHATVNNYQTKKRLLDKFYRYAFKILGIKRFVELLLALQKYSRFENQLFLVKEK